MQNKTYFIHNCIFFLTSASKRLLFQRLYNWIKYKTLPPSVLFKNRLFIERDSKHRRIFNNFGLVFRNSKWSNYEMYNIKPQFQWVYFKYVFWSIGIFFFLFISFKFKRYYIYFYFFNNISFLFWVTLDSFDYYLTFLIWLVTLSSSLLIRGVYSYFFFNNFSDNRSLKKIFSNEFFSDMRITANMSEKESSLSKQNYSWLLYSWLVNEPSSYHRNFLEKLFESSLNLSWWLNYYDFFIKLFKASYLCKLTDERFSTYYLNTVICRIKQTNYKADYYNLLNSLYNNNLLSKYSALSSWYVLNRYSNYFEFLNKKSNSTFFFKKQYEWNTFFFNLELNKYNYLLKFKQGFFFFNELNFSNLFKFTTNLKELWAINHYVKNQLASSKWNRWLYKYSILHRKVLKNSHKITTAKRLLNSGFYNNKLFDRNVWASETLKKYNTSFNFNGAFNLYYPNNFTDAKITIWNNAKKFIINNSNNYDNLALLSQYENSYFWTLKRFYLFNTMSSNKTSSSLFFKNNANFAFNKKNEINRSATLSYFFFNSNLLKSFVLNNFQFSFGYETPFSANFFVNNFTARSSFLFNLKDTYNVVFENELFNLDDLQFISWISTAPLTSNTSSSFFNYLLILNSASFVESSFRDKKNNSLLEISDYILFSEFELDEFFFTDFYIYSILSNK